MSKFWLSFIFFITTLSVWGQVLDDSTKQIYSNQTVEFFYEKDILRNMDRPFHPDSLLTSYHYTTPIWANDGFFQDLGNVGTAVRPLFFQKERDATQGTGLHSFKLYEPDIENFKFYNTRSPYTYMAYQQGGGHTQFEIIHSQNVNPRLNFTLNIFKFNSEKQYGFLKSGEVLVNHWKYSLSSNYKSSNNKYRILAAFYHFNHKQNEQGGVQGGDSLRLQDIEKKYDRVYAAALSGDIYNRERWNNFHVYQQFILRNSIQAFHVLDFERESHIFQDPAFDNADNAGIYGIQVSELTDTLKNVFKLNALSNKLGFKGNINGVNYQAYARFRIYNLTNKYFEDFSSPLKSELFVGGLLGYVFKDSTNHLDANIEFSTPQKYFMDANLFYNGFEFSFYNSVKPVGLFYSKFDNGFISFNKSLKPVNAQSFTVKLPLKSGNFDFVPEANWSQMGNYTYINDDYKAIQHDEGIHLISFGGALKYSSRNFLVAHRYLFSNSSDKTVYPIPMHMHHTNFEFNFLYAKVLRIYTGLDLYYKSKYRALYYSPLMNLYYVDREGKEIKQTPILNAYVKFPIGKGRISMTYHYLNKGLKFIDVSNFGKNGYFTTPGYLGQNSNFTIKIDWPLFD